MHSLRWACLSAGLVSAFSVVSTISSTAFGDESDDPSGRRSLSLQPLPQRDQAQPGADERNGSTRTRTHAEQRPFVYLLDPSTPTKRDVTLEYGLGLASGVNADRPLPASVAASGAVHAFSVGYGLLAGLSPFVTARVFQPGDARDGDAKLGGAAGLRWEITKPTSAFRLGFAGAGFREFEGAYGAQLKATFSYDFQALRVAGNVVGEKVFSKQRDGIDLLTMAGVSYRTLDVLRVGVEYVGQDLEDAFEDEEAEGGAKHFVGPTGALDFDSGRVQIVGGPAFGLNDQAPRLLGRVAVLVAF